MYASLFFFTINFIKFIHKSHFYARVVIHETYFNQSDVFKGPTRLTTELVYGHHAARSQKPEARSQKPKTTSQVLWVGCLVGPTDLSRCVVHVCNRRGKDEHGMQILGHFWRGNYTCGVVSGPRNRVSQQNWPSSLRVAKQLPLNYYLNFKIFPIFWERDVK